MVSLTDKPENNCDFFEGCPNNWSQHLGYVTYVINTSVSESTGHTAFNLIFGLEVTSILDLCFRINQTLSLI